MNIARILTAVSALLLCACASTPEAPGAGQAMVGGFKSTGNPVLDAAMQASAQAAAQSGAEQLQGTGFSQAQANAIASAAATGNTEAVKNAAANAAIEQGKAEAQKQATNAIYGALGNLGPAGAILGNAANSAASQTVNAAADQARLAAGTAESAPGAVDPATGLAVPYDPAAGAVAAAASAGADSPYNAGTLTPGTIGEFKGRPLTLAPAVEGGVKIECFYSNFPPDRDFIPMEFKITPTSRLDELVVKVDPEDGVVMRDGPQSRAIATPAEPYFRRIFAARATDRDSFLRVSTVARTSGSESKRSVLCPLARQNKVPDTGG